VGKVGGAGDAAHQHAVFRHPRSVPYCLSLHDAVSVLISCVSDEPRFSARTRRVTPDVQWAEAALAMRARRCCGHRMFSRDMGGGLWQGRIQWTGRGGWE